MRSQLHSVIAQHRRLSIGSLSGAGEDELLDGEAEGDSAFLSPLDDAADLGLSPSPVAAEIHGDADASAEHEAAADKAAARPASATGAPAGQRGTEE